MLNGHLSDEQLQELAINGNAPGAAHAAGCAACTTKLENYKLLVNAIELEEAPAFEFDLAEAVVAQIETPPAKPKTNGLWWLFTLTIAALLIGAGIYFGEYMAELYSGLKTLGIYFIAITGIILVVILAVAQYKTYQQKFRMLDVQ